ncbi:MAG: anti-sigma factor, partial [Panacibacter sp.]
ADIRNNLMATLADEFKSHNENDNAIASVIAITGDYNSTSDNTVTKRIGLWKYMAAASIILLVASAALNFYLYNNYQDTTSKYQALLTERNSLQANNDVFRTKLNDFEESMRIIENPDMRIVKLDPVAGKESNLATVYWNTKTKDVYIIPSKLAAVPAGKQYQLWAIVDGQPVDAGLIGDCTGVCKMTNTPKAQKFAITLEEKGGSPTPHLDQLFVISSDI